jgi:hypothetical protein
MKRTLFYPVFILLALVSGACADSTLPEPGSAAPGMIAAHGAGPSQSYMLEPVIVVGKCDPYLSLDWCSGGGSCATSVDGGGDQLSGTIFVSKGKHWLSAGLDQDELADSMAHEGVDKILGHVYGQPDTETHGQDFKDKMAACGFPQA